MKIYKADVLAINKRVGRLFGIAYSLLKESRVAYDEWSGYIEESMDGGKVNQITEELNTEIFAKAVPNYAAVPKARHLFGSAITPEGAFNYTDTLLSEEYAIYALKGDPGTKVNDIIGKIADRASSLGLNTERFHCPFIPERIDLLIIPVLKTAVVNTSQPMHMDVTKVEGLNIVKELNLSTLIDNSILNQYNDEVEDAKARYMGLINKAIDHIRRAKATHDDMETFYIPAMDFKSIDKKRDEVLDRILKYSLLYK